MKTNEPPGCAFYEWLITQQSRQDEIGYFAMTVAKLKPEALPIKGGYMAWMQYLRDRRVGETWLRFAKEAFNEFYRIMDVD